ncbi:MAG: hypothetical protein ACXU89_07710, partial [Xanthobacteraceae bacterium]
RRLIEQLPRVFVTEPIPCVRFANLPAEIVGYWSLWDRPRQSIAPRPSSIPYMAARMRRLRPRMLRPRSSA